ncbi:MAG: Rieske (2Fe-2S) protein [Burkholderiales bacterium]|nr:Rieske (2Fe-2S) protein [Opitutaceae bacterium]
MSTTATKAAPPTHRVCPVAELPPGARKIVEIDGRSIGVFNVHGAYHALRNVCPHKLAPLCLGPISGVPRGDRPGAVVLERAGEIVRCPWHGWEFDIATGKSVFNPHRVRVKTYPVSVEPACSSTPACADADPSIETFPVSVQDDWVVLHLK